MKDDKVSMKDIEKSIEFCSCSECGFGADLGIDDISCDEKTCKQCGAKMMTSLKQQNEELIDKLKTGETVEDKLKILVEHNSIEEDEIHKVVGKRKEKRRYGSLYEGSELVDEVNPDIDYKTKYHCENCGIVISRAVYAQESICHKCGDDFVIMENTNLLNERRFVCPECNSSFRYTRINEDICGFCHSMMTVYDTPSIKTSKTPIVME